MRSTLKLLYLALLCATLLTFSCKPDTAKDDPTGTGSGRNNDAGPSEDTTAAHTLTVQPR